MNYKDLTIKNCPICDKECDFNFLQMEHLTGVYINIQCYECGLQITNDTIYHEREVYEECVRLADMWNSIIRKEKLL